MPTYATQINDPWTSVDMVLPVYDMHYNSYLIVRMSQIGVKKATEDLFVILLKFFDFFCNFFQVNFFHRHYLFSQIGFYSLKN